MFDTRHGHRHTSPYARQTLAARARGTFNNPKVELPQTASFGITTPDKRQAVTVPLGRGKVALCRALLHLVFGGNQDRHSVPGYSRYRPELHRPDFIVAHYRATFACHDCAFEARND